jgi:1-acyl-sn-glycerol-3-phosphate acyltransferase
MTEHVYATDGGGSRFYPFARAVMMAIARTCRFERHGLENVPPTGPFIVAANHQSYIDPPMVGLITRRPLSYLAQEELFSLPLLRSIIPRLNAHPIRRGHADLRALRTGLRILASGRPLVLFPEGMRSPDGRLMEPKLGIALLALHSGAPVLPVALDGTNRVLPVWSTSDGQVRVYPRGRPFALPMKFAIRVGKPLTFDSLYGRHHWAREEHEAVARAIMDALADLLGQDHRLHGAGDWWHPWAAPPSRAVRLVDGRAVERLTLDPSGPIMEP